MQIAWTSKRDVSGGVVVYADGLNSHRVRGSVDNIQITEVLRRTLFGSTGGPMELALTAR